MVAATVVPALACDYPDQGNMPLRRAVTRIQMLPETEAWSQAAQKTGTAVQFVLSLDQTLAVAGRCYWTLDAIAEGRVWQRFFVTPDGRSILVRGPDGAPLSLGKWRRD